MPFAFSVDSTSLLLGLFVAVPLLAFIWRLQLQLTALRSERAVLDERLTSAQLAEDMASSELETLQAELRASNQMQSAQAAELAAAQRERELLQAERTQAKELAQAWQVER